MNDFLAKWFTFMGYSGPLDEMIHNYLVATVTGANVGDPTNDLWMRLGAQLGYTGTINDIQLSWAQLVAGSPVGTTWNDAMDNIPELLALDFQNLTQWAGNNTTVLANNRFSVNIAPGGEWSNPNQFVVQGGTYQISITYTKSDGVSEVSLNDAEQFGARNPFATSTAASGTLTATRTFTLRSLYIRLSALDANFIVNSYQIKRLS